MHDALVGLPFCAAFADDVIVFSHTFEDHLLHMRLMLDALRAKGVQMQPRKCHSGFTRLKFLGHIISELGVEPEWDKVAAIKELAAPTTVTGLR